MDYPSMFDPIPWGLVGQSIIQTFTMYLIVLIGVRLVGRRVFGQMGPQDIVVLLLVTEACNLGMTNNNAGYWGSVASVLTIFVTGTTIERITPLKLALEDKPVTLFAHGQLNMKHMQANLVDEQDLYQVARQYGLQSYTQFERITLESDGDITGVLRSDERKSKKKHVS